MILTNSDMRCFATQVLEFFLTVKILSYLQILLKDVLNKLEGGGGGGRGGANNILRTNFQKSSTSLLTLNKILKLVFTY